MQLQNDKSVRRRVLDLVESVRKNVGGPFYYRGVRDPVADYLGIKVMEKQMPLDEGQYIPSSPPQIVIDPVINDPDRRNFTFFHEVTHHLIAQDDDLTEFLNEHAYYHYEKVLERLCNIGAAEFLIPAADVRAAIEREGFEMSAIEALDHVFQASKPAIAIQFATCAPHQCVVVVCEHGLPHREREQNPLFQPGNARQPYLFVQYAACSPSFAYSCGRFVVIPSNHLIESAYQERRSLKGRASIPFVSGKEWWVDCDAHFYQGKVYAAFNVTSPPSTLQLGFNFTW
ncbi:MAG: hypothetical protein DCC55_05110 [Chloroflexi bacterium]|nr:MAG: hypothetical protein DCC55_05110 [Chloroflexota bacterium]